MGVWYRQFLAYHPIFGWWFVPNLKAMIPYDHSAFLLRTNSIGMRSDRDYTQSRPNGHRRLLCLGDSYTAGPGVENKFRFSDILEATHSNLEVMNFGLPGSGTDQQLLIFESLANSFDADGVMLAFGVEDIQRNAVDAWPHRERGSNAVWYMPKPYFTLEDGSLILHNQPVPNVRISKEQLQRQKSKSLLTWLDLKNNVPMWIQHQFLFKRLSISLMNPYRGYESEDNYEWKLMRAILERLIHQLQALGKPLFIIPLPGVHHCLLNLTPTYLTRLQNLQDLTQSVFVLNILPEFKAVPSHERKECFMSDGHYSMSGHKVVARALSSLLTDHYPKLLS